MSSLSGSGSWRRKNRIKSMDSAPGKSQDSSPATPKDIDRLTRALKMNLLRLEGEVDKVRTELGTAKPGAVTPQPEQPPETAWIPMLNAEIVVSESEPGAASGTNGTTKKKSLEEILDKIPARALVHAGFGAKSAEESLARLERELLDFGKQLNQAVRWVRKIKGGPQGADLPAFSEESDPDDRVLDSDTVKMKWEEIAGKIPLEKKPAQKPEREPIQKPAVGTPIHKPSPPVERTGEVGSTQATVRAGALPFVAKPKSRLKPVLAVSVLLVASLAGGAAAYYAFSDRPADVPKADPQPVKSAMVPLTPPEPKKPEPKDEESETIVVENPAEAEDPRLHRARDLGMVYLAKKEYRRAEVFLAPWIREAPDDPELHYLYGRSLFYLGRLKQSARHLSRAIELDPGYADAYFELGGVYMRLRWFKRAEEALSRFIQLRPDEPRAGTVRNLIERNLK
jgi:tetratricopeptide (TPR) repeat protein